MAAQPPPPNPYGKRVKKQKGAGKGTPKAIMDAPPGGKATGKGGKSKSAEGKPICFAFNNGQPCKFTPCNFAHICQTCEGDHPKGDPTCPG